MLVSVSSAKLQWPLEAGEEDEALDSGMGLRHSLRCLTTGEAHHDQPKYDELHR